MANSSVLNDLAHLLTHFIRLTVFSFPLGTFFFNLAQSWKEAKHRARRTPLSLKQLVHEWAHDSGWANRDASTLKH